MQNLKNIQTIARGLLMAASALLAGCGRSAYEARVETGMKGAQVKQMFSVIAAAPVEFPGTPLTLRLPSFIDPGCKAFNEESADPGGQGKINPNRVQPPFLKLPGLRVTYEMTDTVPESPQLVPYYCYLAAVPAGALAADGKPFEESVQAQLATALNVQPQWETSQCPTEAGPKVEWRKISVTGPQVFIDVANQQLNLPGIFELYTKEMDEFRVIIAWRWPQKIPANVSGPAQLSVGSVTAPAAPAANPPAAGG